MMSPPAPDPQPRSSPWPITVTVGGPVDPADHIGHEDELHQVLTSTQSVGALLVGDRRMGKTSLLRKAQSLLSEHVVLRISAETDDVDLFARRLLDVLKGHSAFAEEIERWNLLVDIGYRGIRLRREPRRPDEATDNTDDLFEWAAARASPRKLVVMIDEVTVLANALERQRAGAASEFLRSLRRARQELDDVSIVLSGSVGLHHAVRDPTPINDLHKVRIGPLAPTDAVFLARCLMLGEGIEPSDEVTVATSIAEQSDGIPYFIHHIVAEASRRATGLTPSDVVHIRESALIDEDDPWNLRHYRARLTTYYGPDADLVLRLLDAFAIADRPLDLDGLSAQLSALELDIRPDRSELLQLVESLEADHYLDRVGDSDRFSTRILRDAWRRMRRL